MGKRALQKRPTQETYTCGKRTLGKRPTHMAKDSRIGRSCGAPRQRRAHGKRPTNETYINGEKSPTKKTYICGKRTLGKRPTYMAKDSRIGRSCGGLR